MEERPIKRQRMSKNYSIEDIQPLKDCLSQGGAMETATGYYRAMVRGSMTDTSFTKLLSIEYEKDNPHFTDLSNVLG